MDPPAPPAIAPLPLGRSQEWRAAQHAGPVVRVLPLPGSNKLVTAGRDGGVRVYRATDLRPLQTCAASEAAWIADAVVTALDGQPRLAVATLDRAISFFNALPAERDPHRPDETICLGLAGRLRAPVAFGPATALAALPDGGGGGEERLALGGQAGGVFLLKRQLPMMGKTLDLDPASDLERLHAGQHGGWVSALAAAPRVGLLSASLDGSLAVFDPSTGFMSSCSKALHGGAAVRCLAYHEPTTLAASGGVGRAALLWHPRGDPERAVGELPGHEGGVVAAAAATMDGSHAVATLSGGGALAVWDLRTMRPLHRAAVAAEFPRHDDAHPSAVSFDPERRRVVTAARRPCAWRWGPAAAEEAEKTRGQGGGETPVMASEEAGKAAGAAAPKEAWRRAHSRLLLSPVPD